MEEEIFKNALVDINKLLLYGFKKENDKYKYIKKIGNNFKVIIDIDIQGKVKGYIWDLSSNSEYYSFRIKDMNGSFINKMKEEFIKILKDIKDKCFNSEIFNYEQTNRIVKEIKLKYNDDPVFKWEKYPRFAIFNHSYNNKWYALIMNIEKSKIDIKKSGEVEIINLKIDKNKIKELLKRKGFYQAYHMNKQNWITIILDNTINDQEIMDLIIESYNNTK